MFLLAMLGSALAAEPYYVAYPRRVWTTDAVPPRVVARWLRRALRKADVPALALQQGSEDPQPVAVERKSLEQLTEVSVHAADAVLYALHEHEVGVELDLLVREGIEWTPVSVVWDEDLLTVSVGEPWTGVRRSGPTVNEVVERWGVQLETDGQVDWRAIDLAMLDDALALLSPEELELVRDVPFRRSLYPPEFQDVDERPMAIYTWDPVGGHGIHLYVPRTDSRYEGFVGHPSDPRSVLLRPLLHEMGHAVAEGYRRQIQRQVDPLRRRRMSTWAEMERAKARLEEDPDDAEAEQLLEDAHHRNHQAADELIELGIDPDQLDAFSAWATSPPPVAEELELRMQGAERITAYSDTSPTEHFAEFFAFAHLDPDGISRAYPSAGEWLLSGRYLKILADEQPPARVDGAPSAP